MAGNYERVGLHWCQSNTGHLEEVLHVSKQGTIKDTRSKETGGIQIHYRLHGAFHPDIVHFGSEVEYLAHYCSACTHPAIHSGLSFDVESDGSRTR